MRGRGGSNFGHWARGHSEGRPWGATTLGLRPWRAGRPELLARSRRRPRALAPGVDAPAGVSGTAALHRSRARPAPLPPSQRAAASNPHRSWAAPQPRSR